MKWNLVKHQFVSDDSLYGEWAVTVSQWHQKPYWCRPRLPSSQSLQCLWRWRGCQEKRHSSSLLVLVLVLSLWQSLLANLCHFRWFNLKMAPLGLPLPWKIEASQSLFRLMGSNSLFRYVSWVSSGSGEICPFSHWKTCLSTTFTVFNPKKRFWTFSKAMALEKMDMCVDRCLIIIVTFALFRLPCWEM